MDSGIVLFDGTCAFCERSVVFIAKRDSGRLFRFGATQTPEGAALLDDLGVTDEARHSLVLVEDGQVFLRSTASLRIAARLTRPWRWARVLLWLPVSWRDAGYRVVAAVRYRLAGRSAACDIPPAEIRGRLITS